MIFLKNRTRVYWKRLSRLLLSRWQFTILSSSWSLLRIFLPFNILVRKAWRAEFSNGTAISYEAPRCLNTCSFTVLLCEIFGSTSPSSIFFQRRYSGTNVINFVAKQLYTENLWIAINITLMTFLDCQSHVSLELSSPTLPSRFVLPPHHL